MVQRLGMMRKRSALVRRSSTLAALVMAATGTAAIAADAGPISDGDKVSIEYTLKTTDDGKTVDSNAGREPLVYTQGSEEILPALEKQLVGLKAGDTKKVKLSADDGYGKVHPEAVQNVPKDKIPEDARKAGAMLRGEGPNGEVMMARVVEVKDDTVVVDFNHPLAGKPLEFDIKVVKVEVGEAPAAKKSDAAKSDAAKPDAAKSEKKAAE